MLARFWYFVLAATLAAAMAAAYLVHAAMVRRAGESLDEALRRDRFEVELWLATDDHARIDAIGPMATNADVRTVLEEASRQTAAAHLQAGSRSRLNSTLAQLNRQLEAGAADVLAAVDSRGVIVTQIGGGPVALDASLRNLPFVQSALEGQSAAGLWLRDGTPLRACTRPVIGNGSVVGVIVHAMEVDDELAQHLAEHVEGSSIGFFYENQITAAAAAAGSQGATEKPVLQGGLASARSNPDMAAHGRVGPVEVGEALAIYAQLPGKPLEGKIGFVVARAPGLEATPFQILGSAPSDDVAKLPWAVVAGIPLALALLGLLLVFVEKDRPLAAFATELRKIADGSAQRVASGTLKAQFRIMAEDINAGLERSEGTATPGGRASQNLDDLLASAPPAESQSYYAVPKSLPPPRAKSLPPPPRASVPPPRASVAAAPPPPAIPAAPRLPSVVAPPPPPAPASPAAPAAAAPPPPPAPTPAPEPSAAAAAAISAAADEFDEDGATTVAAVPSEMIANLVSEAEEEERHFKETYEEYMRVREQCGEPTKGLTFEKFVVNLKKTKDQIVAKHGGSRVRFTVYVKEGKTALKAQPK